MTENRERTRHQQRNQDALCRGRYRPAGRDVPWLSRILVFVASSDQGPGRSGIYVVVPDQRGYGQTEAPSAIESYSILYLVGDIVGLVNSLGVADAIIVGHDWGAPVAWHCALLRPDLFGACALLSVPYIPWGPGGPP